MARHYPGGLRENLRSPVPRAAVETFLDVFSRPSLTWEHLEQLRSRTSLPILLKGIQDPRDAALAAEALKSQAEELATVVAVFQLDNNTAQQAPQPPRVS